MTIQPLKGACHCGQVKFEVHAQPRDARRCDCSLCRRKGAVMFTASADEFKLVAGQDNLKLYQWNTMAARHYFCKTCGIYTHNWRRSAPEFGYNSGCLESFDLSTLVNVPTGLGSMLSVVESSQHE
jgi:hypothetical protein